MKDLKNLELYKKLELKKENLVKENGYRYPIIVSSTNKELYGNCSDEEIIKLHCEHILNDFEDDLEEIYEYYGFIENDTVYALILGKELIKKVN